jgi:hypothetical protein
MESRSLKGVQVMIINLNNCKEGDQVTTRDGKQGIYVKRSDECIAFPHIIQIHFPSSRHEFHYTDDGMFMPELGWDGLDIVSVPATPAKEKQVREWFEGVKQGDLRRRLLTNLKPRHMAVMTDNIASAISCGFTWADTPEGHHYWAGAYAMAQEVAP